MHDEKMGLIQFQNAKAFGVIRDLDLRPSYMVLTRDASVCLDDHLRQIIFKSHHE